MNRSLRRIAVTAVAFVAGLIVADRLMTSASIADGPTTTPSKPPTTRQAEWAKVDAVLKRVNKAYANKPIEMSGELVSDFDAGGMKRAQTLTFTSALRADDTYRHDVANDVLVVANPKAVTVYKPASRQYISTTPAKDSEAHWSYQDDDAARTAINIVSQQNPALNIAILGSAQLAMEGGQQYILTAAEPKQENGRLFDRLACDQHGTSIEYWIDHELGTLARVEYDLTKMLTEQGVPNVNKARLTIRYTTTKTEGVTADEALFTFVPPPGASEYRAPAPGDLLGGEPMALEGKPAPAFSLKNLDDKEITLDAAKGKVVVLDFWATWCGPCRAGMPHLAAVAKKHAGDGLIVYAVNQREEAETVRKFLEDQKLELTALLDTDGATGKAYGVSGIPQTVVIGRDGKVRKVIVGYSPELSDALDAAVEAALAAGGDEK